MKLIEKSSDLIGNWTRDLPAGSVLSRSNMPPRTSCCDSKIWSWVPLYSDPRVNALARTSGSCKRHTPPLVRKGTLHQAHNCVTRKKKSGLWTQMGFDTKPDWPTDHRSEHEFDFYSFKGLKFTFIPPGCIWTIRIIWMVENKITAVFRTFFGPTYFLRNLNKPSVKHS
jgi:hypothetical protein